MTTHTRLRARALTLAAPAVALALAAAPAARAAPAAYEGVLVPGIASGGSVGGFGWFLDDGANVDYWRFQATAGSVVTLRVERLNGNLDPALSLYRGLTTADTSAFSSSGSWGGLTFLGSLDDQNPPHLLPGPGGDPFGSFAVTTTGSYTVVVGGSGSTDGGAYPYSITLTVNPVPEPASALLLALGMAGLGWARRRA